MSDQRALLLSHEQAQSIERGARFLSTLAAVERAHALDDRADFEAILAGVDPVELRLTANVLYSLSFLWAAMPSQFRGGTDGVATSPGATAASSPDGEAEQPSAPVTPLDSRAPCS